MSWACKGHPHLRIKIAVDCVEKGYASSEQVAKFLGLSVEKWARFYQNYQIGDTERIPQCLINLVSERDLRFLTGFTDEQLDILVRVLEVPLLLSDEFDEGHPLVQDIKVLIIFGVLLVGKYNQFRSYSLKIS